MSMERWEPDDMGQVRNWVGRFINDPGFMLGPRFARHFWRMGIDMPAFDVYETDTEVVIMAEIPGYKPGDVEVMVYPDRARISGRLSEEAAEKGANYLRRERRAGNFTRTIALPAEVDADRARATFRHGLLELRVPKAIEETQKGRRVQIEPGDIQH